MAKLLAEGIERQRRRRLELGDPITSDRELTVLEHCVMAGWQPCYSYEDCSRGRNAVKVEIVKDRLRVDSRLRPGKFVSPRCKLEPIARDPVAEALLREAVDGQEGSPIRLAQANC